MKGTTVHFMDVANRRADPPWRSKLRQRLLGWFRSNARDLPWRRTNDPYAVWVSEIMLQQTQVASVIPYFERFLDRFPNVESLAAASEQSVLQLWEGLGYYRRARQLHQAAKILVQKHGGRFPTDSPTIQSLPGIGRYTAGAILSIAFDAREPILEANTIRVLSRLLCLRDDPRSAQSQKRLWSFAEMLLPKKGAGTFNQALMELGSEVCSPRDPACHGCPLMPLCPTFEQGLQSIIPVRNRKAACEDVEEACVVIRRRGKVLLRRCADGERWAGMWDFPRFELRARRGAALHRELADKTEKLTGMSIEPGELLMTLKHGVTRFRITLSCFEANHISGQARNGKLRWVTPEGLENLPLNVTARKIARLLQQVC